MLQKKDGWVNRKHRDKNKTNAYLSPYRWAVIGREPVTLGERPYIFYGARINLVSGRWCILGVGLGAV